MQPDLQVSLRLEYCSVQIDAAVGLICLQMSPVPAVKADRNKENTYVFAQENTKGEKCTSHSREITIAQHNSLTPYERVEHLKIIT